VNERHYFKFVSTSGYTPYAWFNFKPYLPKVKGGKGRWTPEKKSICMCRSGWHAFVFEDGSTLHGPLSWMLPFLEQSCLYEVELKGLMLPKRERDRENGTKVAAQQMRIVGFVGTVSVGDEPGSIEKKIRRYLRKKAK
jgi:hypothetical protein